jgi:hypothetical protein
MRASLIVRSSLYLALARSEFAAHSTKSRLHFIRNEVSQVKTTVQMVGRTTLDVQGAVECGSACGGAFAATHSS